MAGTPPVTTDDWPYIYHRSRTIPQTYLFVSLVLMGIAFLLVRGTFQVGEFSTWHFFFLGAGFMVLETQLISRLALYFGTTWLVTSTVLTAILVTLVLANIYVSHFRPTRLNIHYGLLLAALAADYFFPWDHLPFSSHIVGLLLCFAYAFPVFLAGIIFTEGFRQTSKKSEAFGANILGAVAGGLAQNVSFILGIKMLLLLAIFFYAGAGFFHRLARAPLESPAT
jgi:hypothetical protein